MIEKLKLGLKTLNWRLLVNSVIFAVILGLALKTHSWWWIFFYCVYAFYIYFYFFKTEASKLFFSFLFFLVISLRIVFDVFFGFVDFFIIIFLAGLFFILIGLKSIHFHNPRLFSGIFYYFLIFLGSLYLLIFSFNNSSWWRMILGFIFFYLISKDYFSVIFDKFDGRKKVFSLVLSFASSQLLFVSSFLSIGFLNSASLVLIFWTVAVDLSYHFFCGILTKRIIIRDSIIFIVFSLLSIFIPLLIN